MKKQNSKDEKTTREIFVNNNKFDQNYRKIERKIFECGDESNVFFMLGQDSLKLLNLLCAKGRTLIPNLSMGEMSLCADEWDGYSLSKLTKEILAENVKTSKNSFFQEDFLEAPFFQKYNSIIVFPPFRVRTDYGRSEVAYLEKSLMLLAPGGRLIALVPQNITTAPAFRDLRELILRKYSLEAVFSVKRISRSINVDCSILVIENKKQTEKIYMSLGGYTADEIYNDYIAGQGGFFVLSNEVYDRIDAYYYDPKYKEIRELVQNRDTVKLRNLAEVFTGILIPSIERKDHGEYLIIKPQYISDGVVRFGNNRTIFCSKKVLVDRRLERCILKPGDVLVSTIGKINWAIYTGDEDFAVANQNVVIIRGKESSSEWIRLFFHTNTGVEYLESQLKFFSHCGTFNHISVSSLRDMAVPDIKMMKITDQVQKGVDIEAKVSTLFRELGWEVKEGFESNNYRFDIALFFNHRLRGVVEVKSYESEKLKNNIKLVMQLDSYQKELGDISVYLFVDEEIYEYNDGRLEQLVELPRPEKRKTKRKSGIYHREEILSIEKRSIDEMSITDKLLLEMGRKSDEIIASLNRIETKVDIIVEKIELLYKQISGYQSLVVKQLDLAITSEEKERIIHAFTEECAEKIIGEVNGNNANKEFNTELQKLVLTFGESAWEKMDKASQTFLVSSKVIFNNLVRLQDIVDYSGVCLLVTKALEVEMGKRFCKNFIAYLKQKYPGKENYSLFPTALLDRYNKPIKPKHFTLGTVAYVLCYLTADSLSEEQINNNESKLLEYSREKIFSGKDDKAIIAILKDYAESVEKVKNDYRNPSAHTNELGKVDAVQCFELLIDVEKLMKRMLDSFDE